MPLNYLTTKPAPLHLDKGARLIERQIKQNVRDALNDVGMSVRDRVRKPIKRDSGADSLYNSIELNRASVASLEVRVRTLSPKAVFRELDMPPHTILAADGKSLAFKPKRARGVIFAKAVKHPGSKGTHSWQHGSTAMRMRLNWAIPAAMEAALKFQRYAKRYA